MNVLGLITARGGSKGIPRKNLAACGGRPLLAWTCEAATEATCITRTVISTDDREIAEYAVSQGCEAPFLRPPELGSDTAKSIDVAKHAVEWLQAREWWTTDVVVLLQPTSPMRTARHIDEAFGKLDEAADAVVSVVEVPHRFKPWAVLALEADELREHVTGDLPFDRSRRQGQPTLYARNGPAIVVTKAGVIRGGSFYGDHCRPYEMSAIDSVDIDDRDDLDYADFLLRRREARKARP